MKKLTAIILAAVMAFGCAAFAGADGQNPAMNIVGNYQDSISQRAVMSIAPLGSEDAEVTIRWGNSAHETVEWHFSGPCVTDGGLTIEYNNGTKKILSAAEDGTITEKIEYENGTGVLAFDKDNNHPVWTDDQENTGARCAFEYAQEYTATALRGVEMGDSEATVREKRGTPANVTETAGLTDLVYNNVLIFGHEMEIHFLIGDDMVRGFRVVTHEGSENIANDLSAFMESMSNGSAPGLTEKKIKSIGEKYCGLTDFSQLGYFDRFAKDGCIMIYIRTSEKDIDIVILDHFLQSREE